MKILVLGKLKQRSDMIDFLFKQDLSGTIIEKSLEESRGKSRETA